jgi:hypothetical protein
VEAIRKFLKYAFPSNVPYPLTEPRLSCLLGSLSTNNLELLLLQRVESNSSFRWNFSYNNPSHWIPKLILEKKRTISPHAVDGSVASEAKKSNIHWLLTVYPQIMWTIIFP